MGPQVPYTHPRNVPAAQQVLAYSSILAPTPLSPKPRDDDLGTVGLSMEKLEKEERNVAKDTPRAICFRGSEMLGKCIEHSQYCPVESQGGQGYLLTLPFPLWWRSLWMGTPSLLSPNSAQGLVKPQRKRQEVETVYSNICGVAYQVWARCQ